MNRIFRLVWSELQGAWIPVAENTRGRGKRSSLGALAPLVAALGASLSLGAQAAPPAPTQLPTGGKVVAGTVAVSQSGATMNIDQASQRGAIDWQTFDLGAQAHVNFNQPSTSAVTLNRVLDSQASQIFGHISANGQVFLTNPNGVYFGPSSSVDVGGLVATTHALSIADFMAGRTTFARDGATGSVVNEGDLNAALGGYIALLAPDVRNSGVIVARAGTVALVAGEAIKLQFDGGNHLASVVASPSTIAGLVENHLAVLAPGGLIILSAQASDRLQGGIVNNDGKLEASGLSTDGGRVMLEASDRIDDSGQIRADAAPGSSGHGGTVSLIADLGNPSSQTVVNGAISARGGDLGGDGGHVETSGSHLEIGDATRVDARAAPGTSGKSGTWLLDPDGFTIAATGGDISGTTLSANLGMADVLIASTSGSGSDGNVNVNDAVSWGAHLLTLTATNDVNINAVMSATGSASLDLEPASGKVNAAFGPNNTFLGKVNFSGSGVLTVNEHVYTVIDSLGSGPGDMTVGTLQGAQVLQNAYYALGSDIDASPTATWNDGMGHTGFTPFGISWGAFDGLGHTISNPKLNQVTSDLALITSLYGNNTVILRNVGIVGGTVDGGPDAAGLVGNNYGTISNSFSTAAVSGFQNTGGLVGENQTGAVITNSYAGGAVSGTAYVGGLVGKSSGVITDSYATGAVTGTTAFIGGLVGDNYFGAISSSFASGAVVGSQSVGGLVGLNQAAGGAGSTITNSYARGAVTGATNVGGLVGENGSIVTNAYATGLVTITGGRTSVGGLIGLADDDGGDPPVSTSVVTNSFWDTQTSGQATSAGGTGLMTAAMTTKATFTGAGWDFATAPVWRISSNANQGYPCLAAFASCVSTIQLSLLVTGTKTSSVYGDAVGTFGYALYDGSTLLDTAAETALGLTVSGTSAFGGAPTATSNAGNYLVSYASGLTLGGSNAADYSFLPGAGLGYTIAKRPLVLTATKTYDAGLAFAAGTISSTNLVGSDCAGGLAACGLGGSASVASKNVNAGSQTLLVGSLALAGASALDTNYTLTGLSGNGSITAQALTVGATGANRSYNGSLVDNVTLTDNRIAGDVLTVSRTGSTFADKNAGTGKTVSVSGITISGTDASNYSLQDTATTTTANVKARLLDVFANASSRVYDGTQAATATLIPDDSVVAGDQLDFSFTGATFANKNVGTSKAVTVIGIALSGTDAGNYHLESTSATAHANITPRALTVGATGTNRSYNGSLNDNATLTDNRVTGDVLTVGDTASTFADKNVGTGKAVSVSGIVVTGTDAGNYTLQNTTATTAADVTPRLLDVFANATSRVYDGTQAATATLIPDDSIVFGDQLDFSYTGAAFANKNVGTSKAVAVTGIAVSGTDAGNYQLDNTTATAHANITPRALTISATGTNRSYNGSLNDNATLADNRVEGDVLTVGDAASTFADKNVGTGKSVSVSGIAVTGTDAGNYTLQNTTATTTANVTPRLLDVFANATSRVYDGTTAATAALVPDDSIVEGDQLNFSFTGASFANKNVGTSKAVAVTGIAMTGTDAGNYQLDNTTATTHANITPRSLVVSATGVDRVYNGAVGDNATLSDNRVAGDVLTVGDASSTFADKNVGTAKAVTVTGIAATGTDAGNYQLANTSASTHADITPRALVVGATGANRSYNGSLNDNATLADNRVEGDVLTVSDAASTFADKNVGTGKAVSVSGIAVSGTDAGNYALQNTTATTTANVTPRLLDVFANATSRVYDGTTAATATLIPDDSLVEGDSVIFNFASASFADKNVGSGKAITVSGIAVAGADGGNYQVGSTTAVAHASITPRALVVSATGVDRVYDGTTTDAVTLADNRVAGDSITLSAAAGSFMDKNVGIGKVIDVEGIAAAGADAGNYTVNVAATAQASIAPRPLTVVAVGTSRVYDGSTLDNVSLVAGGGLVSGDNLTLSATANFVDKNVGMAKTVNVTGIALGGVDAGNYIGNSTATTSADMTPRTLNIVATGTNRVYDGGTSDVVTFGDDRVAGDTLTLTADAHFADKNAATAKIVNVTGISATGTDAGNYVFASTATSSADIAPRALTVGATGVDRVFDGSTAVAVVLTDNRVAGDVLALSDMAATTDSPAVGVAKPVAVVGIAVGGVDAGNYSLQNASATTSATIVQAPSAATELPQLPVVAPTAPATTRVPSPLTLSGIAAPVTAAAADAATPETSGILVSLVRPPSGNAAGAVSVAVPRQIINDGRGFSFPLPAEVTQALSVGGATVQVTRLDDSPLPAWLQYASQNQTFDVTAAPAGALPFEVKIVVDGRSWILVLSEKDR